MMPPYWRAIGLYAVAALVLTWPLVLHPFTLLGSVQGPGDSYLNLYILGWDLRAIVTDPSSILMGRVFDANMFHPATGTLTYSDHLLPQALVLAPVYLLTGSLVFCYNLMLVGSLILCALAMHAYAWEVEKGTGTSVGPWVAGFVWGFAPYHFSHLIHIQLQALYFLPLSFLFLHRVVAHRRRIDALFLGLALAGQALSSVYYGLIGAVGLFTAAVVAMAGLGWRPAMPVMRRLVLAAVIGAAIVSPVALKYWLVQQREGFGRSLYDASQGSATAGSYLEVPPSNLVYGKTGLRPSHDPQDQRHKATEQNLFPGFVAMGLAVVGLSAARRRAQRPTVAILGAVAMTGFVLSLGPDGFRSLYGWLYDNVFGFQAIRAPARFAVLTLFGVAALAAIGLDEIARRKKQFSVGFVAAVGALVALECANAPLPLVAAPVIETPVGRWLRDAPEAGAVAYLPLELDPASNTTFMLESLAHGRPIVNGYSGVTPSLFVALIDTMKEFPSAASVKTLLDLHVPFVVTAEPITAGDLPILERARFQNRVIYEVRDSPELDSKLVLPDAPALPDPESIPFRVGEEAIYSVVWASGPVAVPAGQIVIQVREGSAGARYQLEATGTTADWVSRFFEANDRFVSNVDERLRPLSFEQHLREGRRQIDRRVVFDRAARVARLSQGEGPELSVPVPLDTLDPLSLLFYVRSRSLTPGSTLRVPLNDARRNYSVDVRVVGVESIVHDNVLTQALRVEPEVRRPEGAIAFRLIVWFSRDAAGVPLAMDVSGLAGVGSVKLRLESIR